MTFLDGIEGERKMTDSRLEYGKRVSSTIYPKNDRKPTEGWSTEGQLTRGGGIHHYYREGTGGYSWGLKGICHRSGVIPKDSEMWPEASLGPTYRGVVGKGYAPTDACRFCVAKLRREGKPPGNLLPEVVATIVQAEKGNPSV